MQQLLPLPPCLCDVPVCLSLSVSVCLCLVLPSVGRPFCTHHDDGNGTGEGHRGGGRGGAGGGGAAKAVRPAVLSELHGRLKSIGRREKGGGEKVGGAGRVEGGEKSGEGLIGVSGAGRDGRGWPGGGWGGWGAAERHWGWESPVVWFGDDKLERLWLHRFVFSSTEPRKIMYITTHTNIRLLQSLMTTNTFTTIIGPTTHRPCAGCFHPACVHSQPRTLRGSAAHAQPIQHVLGHRLDHWLRRAGYGHRAARSASLCRQGQREGAAILALLCRRIIK